MNCHTLYFKVINSNCLSIEDLSDKVHISCGHNVIIQMLTLRPINILSKTSPFKNKIKCTECIFMFSKKRETMMFTLVYDFPLFCCENQIAITIIKENSGPKLKLCPGAPSKFRSQKTQLYKGALPSLYYSANLCYFINIDKCTLKECNT